MKTLYVPWEPDGTTYNIIFNTLEALSDMNIIKIHTINPDLSWSHTVVYFTVRQHYGN